MPKIDGVYVAPTWNNDAAPAIDAEELQDMTDAIETHAEPTGHYGIGTAENFGHTKLTDNPVPQMDASTGTAASGAAVADLKSKTAEKTVTGTYTGTGTAGQANPNTLAFPTGHIPTQIAVKNTAVENQGIIMFPALGLGFFISGEEAGVTASNVSAIHCSATQNAVSWYSTVGSTQQCNRPGATYRYSGMY